MIIASDALVGSEHALRTFHGEAGGHGYPHEGLLFWAGRRVDDVTCVFTAITPASTRQPLGVATDEVAMGDASRTARSLHLGIVGQVHTHPGSDVRHSDGDDDLAFMPFEGMLSIVVPSYGRRGLLPLDGLGVHQFQDGRFVWIEESSAGDSMVVVPSSIDLR